MAVPTWILAVQALATPVVAAAIACVALQQFRVAKQKLKLDLYDKRYRILDTVTGCVITALNRQIESTFDSETIALNRAVREARFLFDEDVFARLNQLESVILTYRITVVRMNAVILANEPDGQARLDEHLDQGLTLLSALTELPVMLKPYLAIDDTVSFSRARSAEATEIARRIAERAATLSPKLK